MDKKLYQAVAELVEIVSDMLWDIPLTTCNTNEINGKLTNLDKFADYLKEKIVDEV